MISGQTYTFSGNGKLPDNTSGLPMKIRIYNDTWSREVEISSTFNITKSVTFVAPSTGVYIVSAFQNNNSLSENITLNWVKLEIGDVATPYTLSLDNYIPSAKEYDIETQNFTSFNRKKLSQKNIELTFTDPKIYKRKTNNTIDFFD
jgi:hypothetical protein